jgi:hypothetical protein
MENKLESLRRKCSGKGVFGDYDIFGFQYGNDAGRDGWLITIWMKGRDPVNTYWLEGEEFLIPRVHYGYNFSDNILVETFGTVPNMDPKKKVAIFQAIATWKKAGKP